MRQILKNELGVKPLKLQELTPQQKENRLKRAKGLLRLAESGELPNLFFSDEKSFGHSDGLGRHNSRWSLCARINRPWHQNKCRILSRKYFGGCIKTQHHRTQYVPPKNGYKMRFIASFPAHNGYQNLRIQIRWTIVSGVFWKSRLALENTKVSITSSASASPGMGQNTADQHWSSL